jgi:GH25 family lysozyme M1 (1,4-beta-N-acetylmuramidase)
VALSTTAAAAATSTLLNGVDVSSFQHPVSSQYPNGAPINWTQVATQYHFAAIKATEGSHVSTGGFNGYYANPYYVGDAQAATAAGMYVSAYHFANPFNSGGAAQADLAAQYAGQAQNTAGTDYKVGGMYLPLMLDLEYNPYVPADGGNECYGLTPSAMVSWISGFVAEATTDTGAAPIIYTPAAWWNLCTGSSTAFSSELLWIPSYSTSAPSTLPAGWSTWSFWQYTSAGSVPGITGNNVDLDYFDGSLAALNAIANPRAVGAEGTDGQLWAQAPQLGAGWHPLGGKIVAAPAVAAAPNSNGTTPSNPLFIGTGADQHLWIRSATDNWQAVGGARCIGGPAAVITGTTSSGLALTVACRGTDNALWYSTVPVPSTGLPTFTSGWNTLGGVLSAGPAVAPVGGTLTFFVRGSNGQVFTRTVATGYASTPWFCTGQPAAALQAATGTTTFACNASGALRESANNGSGWTNAVSLGGSLLGGPAVAAASQETDFLAEGTDQAVWQHTPAGWSNLGGKVTGGVGATALN